MGKGFDTQQYLDAQIKHISDRLTLYQGSQTFMEFGGKPFGDYHAARVLPGYEPDCKAEILTGLLPLAKVVMVVNARDILLPENGRTLQGRIRGDSGLNYDDETMRLVKEANKKGIPITDVVLSITPRRLTHEDFVTIRKLESKLNLMRTTMHVQYEIPGYPDPVILQDHEKNFGTNENVIEENNTNLVVFSPGGGSGKFGVILAEMYRSLTQGGDPSFIKFETFPVFTLEPSHALNLAFEAATADLNNTVVDTGGPQALATTYDKDIENFALLQELFRRFGGQRADHVLSMLNPTHMGVNRITDGITIVDVIVNACREEIVRRVRRYEREVTQGRERPVTVERTMNVLRKFDEIYYRPSANIA